MTTQERKLSIILEPKRACLKGQRPLLRDKSNLPGACTVWGEGCILTENFDCAPVRKIAFCHTGVVANVHFKLGHSLAAGHKMRRKVESSSSEAKVVRIGAGSLKIFPSRPAKGTNGLSFFTLEGKIEQRI